MQLVEVQEIIDCLPKGKTRFYYFRDRYALLLLSLFTISPVRKREMAGSHLGRLLQKPTVQAAIRQAKASVLTAEIFNAYWPRDYECYFLTLSTWGSRNRSRDQVSRQGYNLVLQLNFSSKHDEPYKKLLQPGKYHPYECSCHPVNGGAYRTLAWSRLDIDLAAGEALVEEVQTDWIREALFDRKHATDEWGKVIARYVDDVLQPHVRVWDEAMLAATIWFLRQELGISAIFYHTYESGAVLKRITYGKPPRSVYTSLPKKFCFSETASRPAFLRSKLKSARAKRAIEQSMFRVLRW